MLKFLIFFVFWGTLVSGDALNNSSFVAQNIKAQIPANSTQQAKQPEVEISPNVVITNEEEKNIGKGEAKLLDTNKEQLVDEVSDEENFKYYWVLLVFSSLSIIGLIVFKSFRLRRTRAEIKYGKPKEADEIQPLGKNKWDDVDSSENEDEIFDINFLKNTRLNPPSDV